MSQLDIACSVLVFELNKKILLFKSLTKSFEVLLKAEIEKNYSTIHTAETCDDNDPLQETDANLFYQYFAPIIISFEISKDLNFVYECMLFNKQQHIIRFSLYKNCLIICVYDSFQFHQQVESKSTVTKMVHVEYYSKWYCKSFVSLMKYKFGICSAEKCFNNQIEMQKLFLNWSDLYVNNQLFFVEAIEQLEVNEDIRIKCFSFMKDLVEFFSNTELVMGELDYIDENILKLPDEETFAFENEASTLDPMSMNKLKYSELENFFTDVRLIDQFVLSYGSKLLYKFKGRPKNKSSYPWELSTDENKSESNSSAFSIDSCSLFMVLLEATEFIECTQEEIDEMNEDLFKSATSTPVKGLYRDKSQRNDENFMESYDDDFYHTPYENPRVMEYTTSMESTDKTSPVRFTKLKKSQAFLLDTKKRLGFYDILFLKLDKHLSLTMLKSHRLNKYCHLISDFDKIVQGFLDLLNRKRIELSDEEQLNQTVDSVKLTRASPSPSIQRDRDDQFNRTFRQSLGFYTNKIMFFFESLASLKHDLLLSKKTRSESRTLLTRRFRRKSMNESGTRTVSDNSGMDVKEPMGDAETLGKLRKVELLQLKINRLTNSKEFKEFFSYINSDNNGSLGNASPSNFKNKLFSYLRIIETQLNAVQLSVNELFYDLFLASKNSMNIQQFDRIINLPTMTNSPQSNSPIHNLVIKSTHVIENLHKLYRKHLYHYTPFMELKFNRNIAISYYWYQFPGLVHFSFINRQTNLSVIPTIESYESSNNLNISEQTISLAYRKYLPIIQMFLYKHNCTQFQFVDDKLKVVFSYLIWFEDKKFNYIPVDFAARGGLLINNSDSFVPEQDMLRPISPGITDKNYYELLPKVCYPNAPEDSLTCFELYCVHSMSVSDSIVKNQLNLMMTDMSKKCRTNSFSQ